MIPHAVLYARVSSPKRNGHSRQSTDSQKLALTRYARDRRLKDAQYIEDHATGRHAQRDGLQTILEQVRRGMVTDLCVWKLDRLSRSLTDMIQTFELLLANGCTLHVTSQGLILDARSPFTDFLVGLFGLLARMENSLISERIRSGLAVARERGQKLGAPTKDRRRSAIQKYIDNGMSHAEIARKLKVSRQAVSRMVCRMQPRE